jgi:hypothetical protein
LQDSLFRADWCDLRAKDFGLSVVRRVVEFAVGDDFDLGDPACNGGAHWHDELVEVFGGSGKALKYKVKDGGRDRDRTGDPLLAKRVEGLNPSRCSGCA